MSSIKQLLKKRSISLELGEYVEQSVVHFRPNAVRICGLDGSTKYWMIVDRIKMWSKSK
jgi:hypothetical protein